MAEEEQKDQEKQPEADQPEAEQPDAEPAEAEQPEAEQPDAEPAEAEQPDAEQQPAAAPGPEAEPVTPKQRRKLERSRASGPAAPQRSPEERARERAEQRSRKAAERSRWRRKQRERKRAATTAAPAPTAPEAHERGARKVRRGIVVSSKPDKTITVRIDSVRPHPLYGKVIHNTGTLHAHDERNQANEGDVVRIVECRPLSRSKRWRLLEIVERAQ
jgi:small subunit ribosomal protein S17